MRRAWTILLGPVLVLACAGGGEDSSSEATSATTADETTTGGACEDGVYSAHACRLTAADDFDWEAGCREPCAGHTDCGGDGWCLDAYVEQPCDCPEGQCCDECRAEDRLCFAPEEVPCVAKEEASCLEYGLCKWHSVLRPALVGDVCTFGEVDGRCTWVGSPGDIWGPIESCWKPVDVENGVGLGVFFRYDNGGAVEILYGEQLDAYSAYPGWTPCAWGEAEGDVEPPECACACVFHPL